MLRRLLLLPLRLLAHLASWLLALLILFEEWGWEPLQRLLERLGRWSGLRRVEARVRTLPPWGALALFALPTSLLLPTKLLALWAMQQGHLALGVAIIVAAKLVGTAVVARIFALTQPRLMQLRSFVWIYSRWMRLKRPLLEHLRASWPWRLARGLKRRWRLRWRAGRR